MVVDFETQAQNNDIVLEETTKYKARNLLRTTPGDINHLPNLGFSLEWFNGQTQKVLKLAISRYLMGYGVELENIQMEVSSQKGYFQILEKIASTPYKKQGAKNGI